VPPGLVLLQSPRTQPPPAPPEPVRRLLCSLSRRGQVAERAAKRERSTLLDIMGALDLSTKARAPRTLEAFCVGYPKSSLLRAPQIALPFPPRRARSCALAALPARPPTALSPLSLPGGDRGAPARLPSCARPVR
jgi:hypothetical protein